MTTIRSLARHLRQCASSGREPMLAAADTKLWFLALSHLIAVNALDAAAFAAPRLSRAFPAVASFRRTALLLAHLPPPVEDTRFSGFVDEDESDVQVVPQSNAGTVIFAFTGRYGGLGMPVSILHRWFGAAGAHVVYLRDQTDRSYIEGIASLAEHRAGTVRALRNITQNLGADRVACYGNSSGGYGALLYALELPAAAVLAFGAITEVSPAMVATRVGDRTSFPEMPPLRLAYEAAEVTPKARLVFGSMNEDDAWFARRLEGLPGITLDAVASWGGHDAQTPVVEDGRMGALLKELVSGGSVEGDLARSDPAATASREHQRKQAGFWCCSDSTVFAKTPSR